MSLGLLLWGDSFRSPLPVSSQSFHCDFPENEKSKLSTSGMTYSTEVHITTLVISTASNMQYALIDIQWCYKADMLRKIDQVAFLVPFRTTFGADIRSASYALLRDHIFAKRTAQGPKYTIEPRFASRLVTV